MPNSTDPVRCGRSDSSTNLNLIESLVTGDRDSDAWPVFVQKYSPLVIRWCMRWGATEDQAEEVLQETLLIVYRKFRQYRPRPGFAFRSWLKTIAFRNRLKLVQAQQRWASDKRFEMLTPEILRLLSSEEACSDFGAELDSLADREVMDLATKHAEAQVEPRTWECFRLMQFEERSGEEVASLMSMNRIAVYKAVSRVRRILSEEIARIDPVET